MATNIDSVAVQSFTIEGGKEVRRENRLHGHHGWLLYDSEGDLVRGLNMFEQAFIDGALAAKAGGDVELRAKLARAIEWADEFGGGNVATSVLLGAMVSTGRRLAAPISEDTSKGEVKIGYMSKEYIKLRADEMFPDTSGPSSSIVELPPLPTGELLDLGPVWGRGWRWTGQQAKAYGEACIAADRAARTPASVGSIGEDEARKQFEALASDSYGFKRSRKGTYVNASVARDWKWLQLGIDHCTSQMEAAPRNAGVVPDGWTIERKEGRERLTVQKEGMGYAPHPNDESIASVVLWHLANDILAAAPAATEAPDTRKALMDWPDEPTPEMQQAGAGAIRIETTIINKLWTANAVYRAMRAAILAKSKGQA